MKNKLIKITVLTLIIISIFNSCKKGDEDPFISLRSRTSRLTGEWSVTSMDYKIKKVSNDTTYSNHYTYLNGKLTILHEDNSYYVTKLNEIFSIDKNGTYTKTIEYENGSSYQTEGNWMWALKNETLDLKNKEAIILTVTKDVESETTHYFEGTSNAPQEILILKKLSNDEIIIEFNYTHTDDDIYFYQKEGTKSFNKK